MKPGDVIGSAVNPLTGNVKLDNLDTIGRTDIPQVPAAHEFGHMLGLDDEYPASSEHAADADSIMNNGMAVRSRHMKYFREWTEAHMPGRLIEMLRRRLYGL